MELGLVPLESGTWWVGGKYYMHHLVRCVHKLPTEQRMQMREVCWLAKPEIDNFAEVRDLLGVTAVLTPPQSLSGRVLRKIGKIAHGDTGAGDLFKHHGISAVFPRPLCANQGVPLVFWIPDFQHLRRPDLMTEAMRQWFAHHYAVNAAVAATVVLSSEDGMRDFVAAFPKYAHKAHVVRFCSVPDETWWQLDPASVASHYGLPDRFFIVCNQFTRHKNHLTLIRALGLLNLRGNQDIHLVCTGDFLDFRHEDYVGQVKRLIAKLGLEHRVHLLGFVHRAAHISLLRHALAVLQPSWFEGWSTVIEDAKVLGKPVLASDLPVHREQLGQQHDWYLSQDDPGLWADAMTHAWELLKPGSNPVQEAQAVAQAEAAQRNCGLAFVGAVADAI